MGREGGGRRGGAGGGHGQRLRAERVLKYREQLHHQSMKSCKTLSLAFYCLLHAIVKALTTASRRSISFKSCRSRLRETASVKGENNKNAPDASISSLFECHFLGLFDKPIDLLFTGCLSSVSSMER